MIVPRISFLLKPLRTMTPPDTPRQSPGGTNPPASTQLPRPWTAWASAVLRGLALAASVVMVTEILRVFVGSNIHEILPGRVYRSAQLSGEELLRFAAAHGIRTIVNLRGCSDPLPWYVAECRATHAAGLAQEDISFSAGRLPAVHEARRLLEVFDRVEYPILLHCRQGADRTGMASAILLLSQTDADFAQARRQLGLRYGHLPVGRPTYLDRFLDYYEDWLRAQDLPHARLLFRHWLESGYCPGACLASLELLDRPSSIPRGEPVAVHVRAHNTGIRNWNLRAGTLAGIHLGFNVRDEDWNVLATGRAGLFDAEVPVGASIDLTVALPALHKTGRYHLFVDMTDEAQSHFYQLGSEPLETELEVR